MAKFNVVGLDDVQEAMLRQDAIVEEAVPEMLKAGGAVMQKAQQEEIKTRFNSRRSTGGASCVHQSIRRERDRRRKTG